MEVRGSRPRVKEGLSKNEVTGGGGERQRQRERERERETERGGGGGGGLTGRQARWKEPETKRKTGSGET